MNQNPDDDPLEPAQEPETPEVQAIQAALTPARARGWNEMSMDDFFDDTMSPEDWENFTDHVSLEDILQDIPEALQETVLSEAMQISSADLDQALLDASASDFACFLKYEMGLEVAGHHQIWVDLLKTGEDVCIMAPRDHGKSLTCVRAYALYKAKYDPYVKEIYILGADQESAVENLTKIKELILTLKSLKHLIPTNWKQGMNNMTSLRLTNGTLLRAKSYFTALRGRHPQLILLDDVLHERNSFTEAMRRKVQEQFGSVIIPMKDKGTPTMRAAGYRPQVITIGTAQSADDMYHHMLGKTEKTGPGFADGVLVGIKQSAILMDANWDLILDPGGELQALWPERYTVPDLMKIKADPRVGTLLFNREYLNQPIVDEMAIFPPSLFKPMLDDTLSYKAAYTGNNPVYVGVDLSVPGNRDGDWTVIFAMEYDPKARVYTPLTVWRKRPDSTQEVFHQIEYTCQAFKAQLGYVEANAFQRTYADTLQKRTNLPIQPFVTTGSLKNSYLTGILGLRPLFELKTAWRFPYKTTTDKATTDQLIREFSGMVQQDGKISNEATHDDICMALWIAWRACQDNSGAENWTSDWSM